MEREKKTKHEILTSMKPWQAWNPDFQATWACPKVCFNLPPPYVDSVDSLLYDAATA